MGKQYKNLTNKDIAFIKKQKLFYIAYSTEFGQSVHGKADTQSSDFGHECRSGATLLFCPYFVLCVYVKFAFFFLIDSPVSFIL